MANYTSVDMNWAWYGDYLLGEDGDIDDTSDDPTLSLRNEMATVIKSDLEDWELDPALGANISEFNGEPNTRANGEALQNRVKYALVAAGIVGQADVDVKVTPISPREVVIVTVVKQTLIDNGTLTNRAVQVGFLYDSTENGLFVLPAPLVTY
jgi:hypothetical protein